MENINLTDLETLLEARASMAHAEALFNFMKSVANHRHWLEATEKYNTAFSEFVAKYQIQGV
jgi:hypothetical protein